MYPEHPVSMLTENEKKIMPEVQPEKKIK